MAYPTIYDVTYSYTGFQQSQQGISAFPGTQLDADMVGLHGSVSALALFVRGVLRSDGALQNGAVTYDSLSPGLQTAGLAPAADWATATLYGVAGRNVIQNGNLYRNLVSHTSGVFATDLAAGKWLFVTALPVGAAATDASQINTGTLPAARLPAFTGDVTTGAGSSATTLATVNPNVGTFGSAMARAIFTVNGKGLLTAVSTLACREVLTGDRTYFVRPDGSDANTGLADSAGGAWLTIQKAYDFIADHIDGGGFKVFVEVRGGAYGAGVVSSKGFVGFNGAGGVVIRGQAQTTATVTMTLASPCILSWAAHGFSANQPFYLTTTGAVPTGVEAYEKYYVLPSGLTANTFQFALTPGGAAVNSSVGQSGTHTAISLSNVFVTTTSGDCFSLGAETYAAGKNGLGQVTIGGMCLSTVTAGQCVNGSGGGVSVTIGTAGYPIEFAACAQDHSVNNHNGWMIYGAGNVVSGPALIHIAGVSLATLAAHGTALTFIKTNGVAPSFTYFAYSDVNSAVYVNNMTFPNKAIVTGPRGFAGNGGRVYTNSDDETYLPGDSNVVEYMGGEHVRATGKTGLLLRTAGVESYVTVPVPVASGGTGADISTTAGAQSVQGLLNTGAIHVKITGVNFNSANTDTAIPIGNYLPAGITKYAMQGVRINNASGTLTTATAGVFSGTGGTGTTIVTSGAITLNTAAANTVNNIQAMTLASTNVALDYTTIYFRVGTAQGSAATADVTVTFFPL